jgi:hypothetical protein
VLYDWKFGRPVKNKATPGGLGTMYYCARHACIATVKKLLKLAFAEALSLDGSLGTRDGNKREHEFLGTFPQPSTLATCCLCSMHVNIFKLSIVTAPNKFLHIYPHCCHRKHTTQPTKNEFSSFCSLFVV